MNLMKGLAVLDGPSVIRETRFEHSKPVISRLIFTFKSFNILELLALFAPVRQSQWNGERHSRSSVEFLFRLLNVLSWKLWHGLTPNFNRPVHNVSRIFFSFLPLLDLSAELLSWCRRPSSVVRPLTPVSQKPLHGSKPLWKATYPP